MQNSETYRQYAEDCRRIAETMSAKDKAIMLEMAKVWDERAMDADRQKKTKMGAHSAAARAILRNPHDSIVELCEALKFDTKRALD